MPRVLVLLLLCGIATLAAETLGDALRAAKVPTEQFPASDLGGKITSSAVSTDDPFLLVYYDDDGSGLLQPPLRVIRYERATGNLRRADLRNGIPENCLGSAVDIIERSGMLYIGTHINPSAGCLIVLSPKLAFKTALSGWLLEFIGPYAIWRRSEVHFMSVHPMHIAVFDTGRNQSTDLFPYKDDSQRQEFSRLIEPLISDKWCMNHNAQCDADNFDADLQGDVIVNEQAGLFGFLARFDAAGFGDRSEERVPPRTVAYLFRERGGRWEHREFDMQQLRDLAGGMSLNELIAHKPELAFQTPGQGF